MTLRRFAITTLAFLAVAFTRFTAIANSEPGDSVAVATGLKPVHYIGVDLRPGHVMPTNDFFKGDNRESRNVSTSLSGHLKWAFSFNPLSRTGRMYPGAYQGIGISYNTFFATSLLGNPVGIYAFQGAPIKRLSPRLSLNYEWNFGATFGWHKFDDVSDPQLAVIGSRVNAYLNFGLMLNYDIKPRWRLTAGLDMSHYSNGNTNWPNAGVNLIGARIGVTYLLSGNDMPQPSSYMPVADDMQPHVSYDLVVYGATRKKVYVNDNEPDLAPGSFGVVGMNFAPMYNFNRYFRAGVSIDAQFDESANIDNHKVDGTWGDDIKFYRPAFHEQFSVGLSARAELVMPIFSINVGFGRNFIGKGKDLQRFYQILALKTYVTKSLFLHVGYQLTNFKHPNNLMIGFGYRFHDRR